MGRLVERQWVSDVRSGSTADTASGTYTPYEPDRLTLLAFTPTPELAIRLQALERRIRELCTRETEALSSLSRFLTRSEAIASSRIEGVAPSAQQAALAELGLTESVKGLSEQAKLVAANMTVVRDAVGRLSSADRLTVEDIVELQAALLVEDRRHHGLRTQQNWIGGGLWSPVHAEFVPPEPESVPELMEDLVSYVNGSAHGALLQAALVHAQFETIHPFTDGNGRVGRALIHTVLERRGLTQGAVIPLSMVLSTLSNEYVEGLTSFRHVLTAGSPEASSAVLVWLETFARAAEIAVDQADLFAREVTELKGRWAERLSAHRVEKGLRALPRAGAAVAKVLAALAEAPVVTTATLKRIYGITPQAAGQALDELVGAGILSRKSIDRGATAFIAIEVLDLITLRERALASTRFDTRLSAPQVPAPALPQQTPASHP